MDILPCMDEKTKAMSKFVERCMRHADRLKDLSQYAHDLLTQRHKNTSYLPGKILHVEKQLHTRKQCHQKYNPQK